MMYRLPAYSYFRAAILVEKKKKEEGVGGRVPRERQPTLLLSTSRAPSRLSEQRKNAAASAAVTPFFFFSLFFFHLFSFSNLRVKMAANENGHADSLRSLNYSQRFKANIEQILKESRGERKTFKGPINDTKRSQAGTQSHFFTE